MSGAKRGRPHSPEPATAYDYRRYIALVQLLAVADADDIKALCEAWGVAPVEVCCGAEGEYYMDAWATIQRLAQSVIDYHRE